MRAQNRRRVSVHCIEGAPVHQSTPQRHKAARGQLTRQCYRMPLIVIEGAVLLQDTSEVQAASDLHEQKLFPPGLNPVKACIWRGSSFQSGNLPTKLARGCAGEQYVWLGYPGRSSGQTQPGSPLQPPEVPGVGWARGAEK